MAKPIRVIPGVLAALAACVLIVNALPAGEACEWSTPIRVGEESQRVRLAVGRDAVYVLGSRLGRDSAGILARRLVVASAPDGTLLPPAPLPADYESVHGVVEPDGELRLLWTTTARPADLVAAAARQVEPGLYTTVYKGDRWSANAPIHRAARLRAEAAGGAVVDPSGQVHFAATGHIAPDRLPRVLHFAGAGDDWTVETPSVGGFIYPRLGVLENGDVLLVTLGAARGERRRDSNSVWAARRRADGGWEEAVAVSYSGERPAFEPVVLAMPDRIDIVWAKDLDGDRATREALWHATSVDGGRTWSVPVRIASGRQLRRPATAGVGEDNRLLVAWMEGGPVAAPGKLYHKVVGTNGTWRRARPLARGRISDFALASGPDGAVHLAFSNFFEERSRVPGTWYVQARCGGP